MPISDRPGGQEQGKPGVLPARGNATRNDRLLILVVVCVTVAMMAVVGWYYQSQHTAMETAMTREFSLISDVQAKQVTNWRRERIGDGRVLMSPLLTGLAKESLAGTINGAGLALMSTHLNILAKGYDYSDVRLVRMDGSVRYRLNALAQDDSLQNRGLYAQLAQSAVSSNDPVLADLGMRMEIPAARMFLTVPVGKSGAFVIDIDPSRFLYPYLEAQRSERKTGESILLRMEGSTIVYLSNLRFQADTGPSQRRAGAGLQLPPEEVMLVGPRRRFYDYRGVESLGVSRRVVGSPWYLLVKIDAAEVEAPMRELAIRAGIMTAAIGLTSLICIVLVLRDQRARVRREKDVYLQDVANETPALLWLSDPAGRVAFTNRALSKFLGASARNPNGNWTEWLHPDDAPAAKAKFDACLDVRRPYADEFRVRRHTGEFRWIVDGGSPRFSPEGEFVGYTGCMLDITERRLAEEALRAVNANLARELNERVRKEGEIRSLNSRLLVAQEEGRKRVARELHDDLSQQIAALAISVGGLKRKLPVEAVDSRERSDKIHQKLVQLAESVRRLSHELHPAVLQYSGLAAALREYLGEFTASSGVAAALDCKDRLEQVPMDVSLCAYRIVQEALRNIQKHAQATSVNIILRIDDGMLRLKIADNGIGMSPRPPGAPAGLGLVSMEERARLVNGTLSFDSKPNEGTTVDVRMPVRS